MHTASVHERRLAAVALLISTGVLAWLISRGLKVGTHGHIDFFDFYWAAEAFSQGKDIYAVGDPGYIYPPLLAFLLQPLALLSAKAAATLWVFVNAFLAATLCALAVDTARRALCIQWPRARTILATAATFLLLADSFRNELEWGNCNLIIMLPVILAIRWIVVRPLVAGSLLALAAALKYLPILFLVWLLARRQWRASAAMLVVLAALLLIPALQIGWTRNAQFLGSSVGGVRAMLSPANAHPSVKSGASVAPTVANILPLDAPYSVSIPSGMARIVRENGLESWALPAGILLAAGACVVACGLVYRVHGRRLFWRAAPACLIIVESVGVATAMVAFSPQTQKRHFNMLIALVAWGMVLALAPRSDRGPDQACCARRARRAAIVALVILAALTTPMINTPWTREFVVHYWNWSGGPSYAAVVCQIILVAATLGLLGVRGSSKPEELPVERDQVPGQSHPLSKRVPSPTLTE